MEYFDVLDENGNKTGETKLREEVHKNGIWHKAVHIWIINDKGEILLQKRSPNKDSWANMWDISSAGHLTAGDDIVEGAIRELEEELGIKASNKELVYLFTSTSNSKPRPDFINNEFQEIFMFRYNLAIENIVIQEDEISEVKFISMKEFKKQIEEKQKDLLIPRYIDKLIPILEEKIEQGGAK